MEPAEVYEIPEEIINYDPPVEAVFVTFSDGKKNRRIFSEPQVFSEEEIEIINKFEEYLKDNGLTLPEGYDLRDAYKHIIAKKDFEKAYSGVSAYG
jgi:hypothetical protein